MPQAAYLVKRLGSFLLSLFWIVSSSTFGQSLDAYGGRTDLKCSHKTGRFYTEKIKNRWWFCTPDGNAFFLQGVGNWTTPVTPKYGNSKDAAAASLLLEFKSWGFNAVGELSYGPVEPISGCKDCTKLPEMQTLLVSNYAAINLGNYAQHPMKNLFWGINGHYAGWRSSFWDVFEPQYAVWLKGFFANDAVGTGWNAYKSSPYFAGVLLDDQDWFWGMGSGPDFHSIPQGKTNSNLGYMVLITSPMQSFNADPSTRGVPEVYTDTKVYSKTAMPDPPAHCSIQTPCSLRDYLFKKYQGRITALNAAWGSNYTTFDSSGTAVTGEVVGTGDGTTVSFSHSLAQTPVAPESAQVFLTRALQGGDCPQFTGKCRGPAGGGSFAGGTLAPASSITYATGQITVTFSRPPPPSASIIVNYIACGWTCGTGLMDEDGRHTAWLGTNPYCLTPATACDGKDNPLPNANPNLGADLDAWVAQFAAEYFATQSKALKAAAPHVLFFGLDTTGGTWGVPARKEVLEGAAPYVDGLFVEWFGNQPDQPTANQIYAYQTRFLGDKPLLNFMTLNAQPDSAMFAFNPVGALTLSTQPLRGQQWNTIVTNMLNTLSFSNTYQWIGVVWWGSHDFTNFEKTDWGLKTALDNAYDGHEAVVAKVSCSPPLEKHACGGEKRDYGDAITWIKRANHAWIELTEKAHEKAIVPPPN